MEVSQAFLFFSDRVLSCHTQRAIITAQDIPGDTSTLPDGSGGRGGPSAGLHSEAFARHPAPAGGTGSRGSNRRGERPRGWSRGSDQWVRGSQQQ